MKRGGRSDGFTLLELLVTMAIIGMLAGVLLPAVQRAREAARRVGCSNNLKTLALACQMYHDVQGTFPPAWLAKPGYGYQRQSRYYSLWGWGALVLPFVERHALYSAAQVETLHLQQAAASGSLTLAALQQPVASYRCPTDDAPALNSNRSFFPCGSGTNPLATSNYVAANSAYDVNAYPNGVRQGAFIEDRGRSISDFVDGTASTFLLGERRWSVLRTNGEPNTVGAAVLFGIACRDYPGTRADVAACGRPRLNCNGIDEPVGNNWARRGFSSQHPGGAYFAFGDGGVRFISDSIDHDSKGNAYQRSNNHEPDTVYERLIAIGDRLPTDGFD